MSSKEAEKITYIFAWQMDHRVCGAFVELPSVDIGFEELLVDNPSLQSMLITEVKSLSLRYHLIAVISILLS